jgi:DNA-binding PadR family transcriptional regulator
MNDLLLLAALLDGPAHGYALKKRVGFITGQSDMHNNLVYPLLKRFVQQGWVSRKTVPGERGQTRARYALTSKGKSELTRRLEEFTAKDAASSEAFQLRVGLFSVLRREARTRILETRKAWLTAHADRLTNLAENMDLGPWGGEVVGFLRSQIAAECKWNAELRKKADRNGKISDGPE